MRLSGWGNYPVVDVMTVTPRNSNEATLALNNAGSVIPRGMGRSYGDSALAACVVETRNLDNFLAFDDSTGELRCAAGISLASILDIFVPRGWFLPVTPGTKFVSVGGAIASDVHGKNHHLEGSFTDHIVTMTVATPSKGVLDCSPSKYADLFHATSGGMGLTGLILEATLKLKRIRSSHIDATSLKAKNLEEALDLFNIHHNASYSVAWIDCLSSGKSLGRSIISLGEHMDHGDLCTTTRPKLQVPFYMPGILLNRHSIKAFNTLYFHRLQHSKKVNQIHYDSFFYPLDKISNWNRLYGKAGFVQYQFALPTAAGLDGIRMILQRIVKSGRGSFLAVLKVLGDRNRNLLSFPLKGYTLAIDFKMDSGVLSFLEELDRMVLDYEGTIYMAKDARMSAETFRQCYPNWDQFAEARAQYGADRVFHSEQSKRLGL